MPQVNLYMLEIAHLAYPVSILRAHSNIRHTDLGAVVLQRTFMQRWHIAALKSDLNRIYVQRLQVGLCPLAESFDYGPQRRPARVETNSVVASCGPRVYGFDYFQDGKQVEPDREDVGRDVLRRLAELRVRTRPLNHQISKAQHRRLVATHVELGTDGLHRVPVDVVDIRGQWFAPPEPTSRWKWSLP